MLLLNITNLNPATEPYQDLHDDEVLEKTSAYGQILAKLNEFFEGQLGIDGHAVFVEQAEQHPRYRFCQGRSYPSYRGRWLRRRSARFGIPRLS